MAVSSGTLACGNAIKAKVMTGNWKITLSRFFRTFNVLFCVQGYLVLFLAGTKFIIMFFVVFPNAFSITLVFIYWWYIN